MHILHMGKLDVHLSKRRVCPLEPCNEIEMVTSYNQRKTHTFLYTTLVSRLNPLIQAEREVLWKLLQLPQLSPHFNHKVIKFGFKILFNTVTKQLRKPPKHGHRFTVRKSNLLQILDSGQEFFLDGTGKQVSVFVHLGYSNALEKVESGSEPVLDTTTEQSGPSVDNPFEIGAVDTGLACEEGEYWDDVGDPRG
ncbi:hypothetical protein G4B88_005038 [Cannabis sativa]|uniref:Uncharacterized protein n=1 Tax=Cannabis sativa TaxID=3483 RepID=A0A7J6H6D1_CANSA|nr:hypothetical protein G4B88_005038 [Cannabis sativa]